MKLNKYLLVLASFFSVNVFASLEKEVNHLLNYVDTTQCQYQRNGKVHSGKQAVAHIKEKYEYFDDDIKTAEDFIRYAASKSMFSGKKYKILCAGSDPVNSQDWLLQELARYRTGKNN